MISLFEGQERILKKIATDILIYEYLILINFQVIYCEVNTMKGLITKVKKTNQDTFEIF